MLFKKRGRKWALGGLLLPCFFLLAAASKLWFIESHSTHLFGILRDDSLLSFPDFLGEDSPPLPTILSFLLKLRNFLFTHSKPMYSILLLRKIVKWEKEVSSPAKPFKGSSEDRLQCGNQLMSFLRPLSFLSLSPTPFNLFFFIFEWLNGVS